ncbi:TPA_asm: hypothetical protein GZX19_10295 [Listeria monocytogenes]|nr:hypothetical protein [Listeria monocytogenes]
MTVQELIDELSQYEANATVLIAVGGESSDYQQVAYNEDKNEVSIYTT